MAATFACPSCKAVLKPKTEIPVGKKVKCPKCATIFVAAGEPERPAGAAVRTPSPSAATRKPPPAAARPATVRSGPPPAAAPTRRRPALVDEDDRSDDDLDRDDEDRPARKRRRKGRKNQGNPVLLWSLIGGGAAFLIASFLIAGLVWPGFLLSAPRKVRVDPLAPAAVLPQANGGFPKGTGNESLLNFVPPGCNVFAGFDLGLLRERPDLARNWQTTADQLVQMIPGAKRGLREIIGETDRALLAVKAMKDTPNAPDLVVIVRTRSPYDPDRIRQIVDGNNREVVNGKPYYKLPMPLPMPMGANAPVFVLHMPNDRVLVFALAPPGQLGQMLSGTGQAPLVSPQAVAEVSPVENAIFWAAFETTPLIRPTLEANQLSMVPDLVPAVGAMQKLKGGSFAIEAGKDQKVRIQINATCASAADAQQLATALRNAWQNQAKPKLAELRGQMPPQVQPVLGPLFDEVLNSLAVANNDARVQVAVEITEQTVKTLQENMGQFQPMFPLGFGPPPGPAIAPPVQPPMRPVRPPVLKRPKR